MTTSSHPSAGGVFIVGATGGVGQHLLRLLRDQDIPVSAMHRAPSQAAAIEATGATAIHGDLVGDSVQTLAAAMEGHAAVVFTAGAGDSPTMVIAVDQRGAIKAADAAAIAGVRRFVLVSVFMDAWRGEESPGTSFERYMAAKRAADVHLSGTDLDWLILRPGTLTDDPGTGRVTVGGAVPYGDVPRADVAAVIARALFAPSLNRVAIELTEGSRTIEDALSRLDPVRSQQSGSPTAVVGLASSRIEAVVPVSDLTAALEFYVGSLGMRLLEHVSEVEGRREARLTAKEGSLTIYESEAAGASGATTAAFLVDDLDVALADLRARGIPPLDFDLPDLRTEDGVAAIGRTRVSWIADPDGNLLGVNTV